MEKANESTEVDKPDLNSKGQAKETDSDPELDELLDSALEDFSKPTTASTTLESTVTSNQPSGSTAGSTAAGGSSAPSQDAMFNEVFNAEAQKQLEDMMKALVGNDPNVLQNIEKLASAADNAENSEDGSKQFHETLQDTLGNLAQNAEQLQGDVSEDIFKLLGNLNMNPEAASGSLPEGEGAAFMPMMQGMMKSLLSKEVLYPSLKDISEKFPTWLDDNKDKIEAKEHENYNQQYKYIKDICTEFDQEKDTDSEAVKQERFDRILDLMQNMQELGYPPKELIGDLPAGFPMAGAFDDLPLAQQCNVM